MRQYSSVRPGEVRVSRKKTVLTCDLEAGLAVCVYDSAAETGGLCLCTLSPRGKREATRQEVSDLTALLLRALARIRKSSSGDVAAKILASAPQDSPNGQNVVTFGVDAVQAALDHEGVPVTSKKVDTAAASRVWFFTDTGRLLVEDPPHWREDAPKKATDPERAKLISLPGTESQRELAGPLQLVVIEGSESLRTRLCDGLERRFNCQVQARLSNANELSRTIQQTSPDAIVFDVNAQEGACSSYLKGRQRRGPSAPVILTGDADVQTSDEVVACLEAGAFEFVPKPSLKHAETFEDVVWQRLKAAVTASRTEETPPKTKPLPSRRPKLIGRIPFVTAIGASTGGVEAIRNLLLSLPETIPPILVTQHIPAEFSDSFAKRVDSLCPFQVREARDGEPLLPNQVLIAPGGLQMGLVRRGDDIRVSVVDDEPVCRQKPSVDYLFRSCARLLGSQSIGVILTGMGADGASGLMDMKQAGARTLAQDEATSVVFGMPREAIRCGAADVVCGLPDIPGQLYDWWMGRRAAFL